MIKISIEAGSDAARFEVEVRARSIRQALSIAGDRYPDIELRVVFPIEPETFFVGDLAAEQIEPETPGSAAA